MRGLGNFVSIALLIWLLLKLFDAIGGGGGV